MAEVNSSGRSPEDVIDLQLYSGIEYFDELPGRIAATQSGGRIAITNMAFSPTEPVTQELFQGLSAAADRNVSTTFGIDAFALLDSRTKGPMVLPHPYGSGKALGHYAMLESFAEHEAARYGIINKPRGAFSNLLAGRFHFKTAVIDDYLSFGGVCLQDCHRIDMMVGMEDKETADWLYDTTVAITEAGSTRAVLGDEDQTRELDSITRILIDAGKPGQSVNMDEACALIDEAEEWLVFAVQFLPTGNMADRIVRAIKRDVDVYLLYNNPCKHDRLNLAHRYILARERQRRPEAFFVHELPVDLPPLHAKAMANEKRGLVGGHNYLDLGVKLGTTEIALERRDPVFARAVRRLLFREIGYEDTLIA